MLEIAELLGEVPLFASLTLPQRELIARMTMPRKVRRGDLVYSQGAPGDALYVVARGSDLPLNDTEFEVLPAVDPTEPPKGIAEVVMMPVAPAILNAIYDATGHRFRSLPVTQAMIKGVLK